MASRRAGRRFEKHLDVSVHGPGLHIVGHTVDISRYGMLVLSTEPRRVGELTQLWVLVADDTWIQVLAIVARVVEDLPGFAVRLHMMGGDEKGKWDQLLAELGDNDLPDGQEAHADDAHRPTLPRFLIRPRNVAHLERMITREIALGGMYVRTPIPRPMGTDVELLMIHPQTERAFRVIGQVVVEHRHGPLQERGNGVIFAGAGLSGGDSLSSRFRQFCDQQRDDSHPN